MWDLLRVSAPLCLATINEGFRCTNVEEKERRWCNGAVVGDGRKNVREKERCKLWLGDDRKDGLKKDWDNRMESRK